MDPQMRKLLDYEKKLLDNRKELHELIQEQEQCKDEAMKEKLNHFQAELLYMEKQLAFLKLDMEQQSVLQTIGQENLEWKNVDQQAIEHKKQLDMVEVSGKLIEEHSKEQVKEQTVEHVKEQGKEQIRESRQSDVKTQTQVLVKSENKVATTKKDLEKTIGKSLMGIVASVLIFISLILFATLLLPYFDDTAKLIAAYLISFAFLGIGLWRLNKDKENKFYLALTGCGFGALYISLLLSNMYFKVIGDIPLYILIGLWAIGVCFLSKLKNSIFQLIGQFGIWISMIFGCSLCVETGDIAKFAALVIFYMISSSIFYIVHYNREFSKNMIHHVFHALNFMILLMGCHELVGKGVHGITILVFLTMMIHIGVCFYSSCQNSNISFGIFLGMHTFFSLQVLMLLLTNEYIYGIASYFICMILILLTLKKTMKGVAGKNIAIAMIAIMAMFCLDLNSPLGEHGIVPLMIIPFLVIGFLKENTVLKYFSLFLFFIYSCGDDIAGGEGLLLGSVVVVSALLLLYKYKEQYTGCLKGFMHTFFVFFFFTRIQRFVFELTNSSDVDWICAYFAAVLFHVGMMKSCFGKNLKTGEEEDPSLYHIINLIFMIYGLALMNSELKGFGHFVVIITTIIIFMANTKKLLAKNTNLAWGIYVGIKFTVLLVAILLSFDAANYVISIACFILAIVSIMIGFWQEYKSLRVFGLILSMISTFKLIMIDIYYDNTLGNAFSFFASGILCFAISLIYNQIDKKIRGEREAGEEPFAGEITGKDCEKG